MMGWRCLAVHIAVAAATVADFVYGDDMETERTREPKSVLWFSALLSTLLMGMLGWSCYDKLWSKYERNRPDTPAYFLNARDVRKERALLSAFESTKALRKTASKASLALKEEKRAEEEEARKALRVPRKNRSGSQTSELEDGTADGYEHGAVLASRTVRSRKSIQGRGGSGGGGSGRDREGSSSSGGGGGNATMTTLPGAFDDGNHSDASSEGRVVLDD